jgi:glycerol-3-phosphate dehydrogenase
VSGEFSRAPALERIAAEELDVLVVGGGITGAGVALDAAARGMRTAIVEKHDWASGTSSKSSKLVHGGLRYLQQREIRLVYENLYERQRLLENAPHLVRPLPFLIPLFGRGGAVDKGIARAYRSALWLYDLTGGIRIGHRHKRLDRDAALGHLPTLKTDLLAAAFLYWDAHADDARLTLAIVRTAVLDHGAIALNHAAVTGFLRGAGGRVTGARLEDGTEVRARAVVNATGVWVDEVRGLGRSGGQPSLRPAKGIHLALRRSKLPAGTAAVLPVPKDRRSIFVVPHGEHVYLGTTDTDHDGPLDDPQVSAEDVAYVLRAANAWVTGELGPADVTGSWAGLRPLVRAAADVRTADLSRRHAVTVGDDGMVTITGGKLTTYRKMAADAVDAAGLVLGGRFERRRCPTKSLRLRGADGFEDVADPHLAARYGSEARVVQALVAADASLGAPLVAGLPYLRAEAVYSARYEMAATLDDVLSRRTRALLFERDAAAAAAADAAALLAPELGWDEARAAQEVDGFVRRAERERAAAGLPRTAPA